MDKKIIRLSECISILPAVTETCPKENMAAFCVETNDKTFVFAAEKNITNEWVEKMCEIAFQVRWDFLIVQCGQHLRLWEEWEAWHFFSDILLVFAPYSICISINNNSIYNT